MMPDTLSRCLAMLTGSHRVNVRIFSILDFASGRLWWYAAATAIDHRWGLAELLTLAHATPDDAAAALLAMVKDKDRELRDAGDRQLRDAG